MVIFQFFVNVYQRVPINNHFFCCNMLQFYSYSCAYLNHVEPILEIPADGNWMKLGPLFSFFFGMQDVKAVRICKNIASNCPPILE